MSEPLSERRDEQYGLLARFETPQALLAAVRALRADGWVQLEAFSPYAVEGVAEALGYKSRKIAVTSFVAAALAAMLTYFMQWYSAVIAYPYAIGGRPLHSWPAFMLATFAMLILFAVLGAVFAMLFGNRLPQPYHPAFNVDRFVHASEDGFFLLVAASDAAYDPDDTAQRLKQLHAVHVDTVPA